MCTHPIHIVNKTKLAYEGATKRNLIVPCGHCEDCRSMKSDEWFQRIFQEIQDCESVGGKVIFTTFTYNDLNVPRFHYMSSDGSQKSFMCFNKHHKDRFLNVFRKYFEQRYHLTGDNCKYPFKYIWCSEYGLDERFTHRPHYHILFFIPKEWLECVGTNESKWKKLIARYWQDFPYNLGFVRWSPGNSIFVNNEFAGIYASKYICKDIDFYHQPEVEEYMKDVKVSVDDKKYKVIRDFLPRHWQSQLFGASLEKIYSIKENYINGYNLHLNSEVQKGKSVLHKCPKYIEKRMLYDYTNTSMKLNDKGKEFKRDALFCRIERDVKKYMQYCDPEYIRSRVDGEDFQYNGKLSEFGTAEKLTEYISSILTSKHSSHSDKSIYEGAKELLLYNRVWSGIWTKNPDDIRFLDNLSHSDFVQESINQYVNSLYFPENGQEFSDENGVFLGSSGFDPGKHGYQYYDYCTRFLDFQRVLDLISECETIYKDRCHEKYLKERYIYKKLKFAS